MTEDAQVRELFRQWQRRLRLDDWSLSLDTHLSSPGDDFEGEAHATTYMRSREGFREAVLDVFRDQPLPVIEWTVVRALVGLVLQPLRETVANQTEEFRVAEELVAQQLTVALLDQPTIPYAVTGWFGRLRWHAHAGTEPES